MRPLSELINDTEPGIALVKEWLAEATRPVVMLPSDHAYSEANLLRLQVTTRSPMGALAYESGGVLVDDGWVRVLGAPCQQLSRGLADWNRLGGEPRMAGALLVGDDPVGGFFAIDGGGIKNKPGSIFYLAPDSLDWEDLEMGYSTWLRWLFSGDLDTFYEFARWDGWREETRALPTSHGFSIHPFLWAKGPPVGERSRRPVPMEELWGLHAVEFPRQLRAQ